MSPLWGSSKQTNEQYAKLIEQLDVNVASFGEVNNHLDRTLKLNGHFLSYKEESIYYIQLAIANAISLDKKNTKSDVYFEKGISIWEKENKEDGLYIWAISSYATYLYTYRAVQEALYYFTEVKELLSIVPSENLIDPVMVNKSLAFFLGTIEDRVQAIKYLKKADFFAKKNSKVRASILDNIGIYYYQLNDFTNAMRYFNEAETIAINAQDSLRYAKVLGNKADVYLQQGLYKLSLNLLKENLDIAERSDSPMHLMYVNRQLALLYLKLNEFEQAKIHLEKALLIAQSKAYLMADEFDILKIKLDLNKKTNSNDGEYAVLKRINELSEMIDLTDGQNAINVINLKYQKKLYEERIELNDTILEKQKFLNRLSIIISILLLFILIILIRTYKMRMKTKAEVFNRQILQLEFNKINSEKKLADTSRDLKSYRTYLLEKNNQIAELNAKIEHRSKIKNNSERLNDNKLNELLKSHLLTEENWKSFKNAFINEYPDFYANLTMNYPDFTESNLRTIFLIKMDLNNHEIANLLGVSYEAVKKAKQRLKKKVDESTIEEFIARLS